MPIYALGDREPSIDSTAYVHPDVIVIGSVTIGPESSIWPGVILRGDQAEIRIGARSNVQDGSMIHVAPDLDTVIEDDVLVGHLVHLEGCRAERRSFISTGAVVLHRAVIGEGALVAANAVVLNDTHVPPGAMALGVPATIRPGAANPRMIAGGAPFYLAESRRYRDELRRLD